MKKIRLDGYACALLGQTRGRRESALVAPDMLYAKGGLFARIVDKPADDAVSGSLHIDGDNGTFAAELERLNAQAHLADALRWCRLTGGAAVLPLADDDKDLSRPLNVSRIGQIRELRVYAADEVQMHGLPRNNPAHPEHGQPEAYRVNTHGGGFTVHASRLITLAGEPMPRSVQKGAAFWQARSAAERPYQVLAQLLNANARVLDILERKQQPVYKMLGLSELVASGQEELVRGRVSLTDEVRGIKNTVTIDGEDDYTVLDLGLSGLPEAVNLFKEQLCAETGIPVSILFGRSAAGLNATGEGDFRSYYDLIDGIRQRQARPALEKLLALIAAQQGISAPDNWRIVFPPLFEPTAKEQAEIAKMQAEAAAVAVNIGAVSETEARERLGAQGWTGLEEAAGGSAEEYAQAA